MFNNMGPGMGGHGFEDLFKNILGRDLFGTRMSPTRQMINIMRAMTRSQLFQLRSAVDDMIKQMEPEPVDAGPWDQQQSEEEFGPGDHGEGFGMKPGETPFTILGVEEDCTPEQVETAFRQKAMETHPDHGGSDMEFIKVYAAYEAIKQFKGWT